MLIAILGGVVVGLGIGAPIVTAVICIIKSNCWERQAGDAKSWLKIRRQILGQFFLWKKYLGFENIILIWYNGYKEKSNRRLMIYGHRYSDRASKF